MTLIDWIGSTGVFLILLAYFLNVTGRLKSADLNFILLNLSGAVLACLASVMIHYIPFVILEGTWAAVSVLALVRYARRDLGRKK
jgi:hypothetical protein